MISALLHTVLRDVRSPLVSPPLNSFPSTLCSTHFVWREIWGQGPVLLVECCSSANSVAQHVGTASFLPDFGASLQRSMTMCPRTRAVAISSSSLMNRLCLYCLPFTFLLHLQLLKIWIFTGLHK
jgi:hypothetical protein